MAAVFDDESEYTPMVRAVHEVLREWFLAIEGGRAHLRQPDLSGRIWTEATLDVLVREDIDAYVAQQRFWSKENLKIDADAGPGFERLAYPQRLALAQELAEIFSHYQQPAEEVKEPPLPWDYSQTD